MLLTPMINRDMTAGKRGSLLEPGLCWFILDGWRGVPFSRLHKMKFTFYKTMKMESYSFENGNSYMN